MGAGTSGRLALLDAVELGPTFSLPDGVFEVLLAGGRDAFLRAREGAEDSASGGARAVAALDVSPLDLVVGVTASGRTPFVAGALSAARTRGARTAAIVCAPPSGALRAEIVVHLDTGPEVLAGSTRMKAGSATKMTLNAFSLGVMAGLGKTYRNLMVDVRIGSAKLRRRAASLVSRLGEVEADRAEELLEAARGSAKTAIVMARRGCGAGEAEALLRDAGGRLGELIDDPSARHGP